MTTDLEMAFDGTAQNLTCYDRNMRSARLVHDLTSLGPGDFQVTALVAYEPLGLLPALRARRSR
jgi:hypothetical protein